VSEENLERYIESMPRAEARDGFSDEDVMHNTLRLLREAGTRYAVRVSREHYMWLAEQLITTRSLLDAERQNHDNTRRRIPTQ
jgi:hypothetical protein